MVIQNLSESKELARKLIDFIKVSPSPFHAVTNLKSRLKTCGFSELLLHQEWEVSKGGLYCVTVNSSMLVCFAVGQKFKAGGSGFSIIGTHTDSPCFKVKPNHDRRQEGYSLVGVEKYGGGIWHTWFDRDLTVAGRVTVENFQGGFSQRLVHVKWPIMRIPHLAIHLDREANDRFSPNVEKHLVPVISTDDISSHLAALPTEDKQEDYSVLDRLVCRELGCSPSNIISMDLCVVDCQDPVLGGGIEEFIFAPRLDNLFNCFCAVEGLVASLTDVGLTNEENVRMVVCYDNEEVGSSSLQGARSATLNHVIERISHCLGVSSLRAVMPTSFMLSADQAHAVHPSYPEKHEAKHQTKLHGGLVLKQNANQSYATSCVTGSVVKVIAKRCSVPCQEYVVRNDMMCGSTIGPLSSYVLGIRTADVGFPMLSMHSVREMCGAFSVQEAITFYKSYFEQLPEVLRNSSCDTLEN